VLSRLLLSAVYTERLRVPFPFMACLFVCYDLLLICRFCGQKNYVLSSEQETTNNPQCERSIRCLQISSVLEIMRDDKDFD